MDVSSSSRRCSVASVLLAARMLSGASSSQQAVAASSSLLCGGCMAVSASLCTGCVAVSSLSAALGLQYWGSEKWHARGRGKQCAVPAHNAGVGVGWMALSRGPKCSSPWKPLTSGKAKERHHEQGPNAAHNESHSPTGERGQVSMSKVQMQLSTEASLHWGSRPR